LSQILEKLKNLHIFMEKREGLMFGSYSDDLADFIDEPDNASILRDKIESLIIDLKTHREEIISKARKNIELVESIFNHKNSIILQADEKTSQFIVDLAINKKFPFENKKNNFADCLIFYQFFNFLKNNKIEQGHFVTSNKDDFFPNGKLHEHYELEVESSKSFFHKSLAEALNKSLNEQLVSARDFKIMQEIAWAEAIGDKDRDCYYCGEHISLTGPMDVSDNRIREDVDQLDLFGDKGTLQMHLNAPTEVADFDRCLKCGTLHVLCPECGDLWPFCNDGYSQNEVQKCESCGIPFIYHSYDSNPGEMPIEYIELLNPENRCEECGEEYEYSTNHEPYCPNCGRTGRS